MSLTRNMLFAGTIFGMACAGAAELFVSNFSQGHWKESDFLQVKSSRWNYRGGWVQHGDHIANEVPGDASPRDLLSRRVGETYSAMVVKTPFSGNCRISAKMSFDHRMAPALAIALPPTKAADGKAEFREHYELVLYDRGINVWHHTFVDGRQVWRKAGFITGTFQPGRRYRMTVQLERTARGPMMTVRCDGREFGFFYDALPESFYAGIIASEGVNRFYDFKVESI